jgi:predicted esterase YcpF (UPF0227 family)
MIVIFSHGKESGPSGSKIKALSLIAEKHGFSVDSIDYSDISSPDHRVDHLLKIIKDINEDIVLVGSSMGGYVSLVASEQIKLKAIFLLAPALYMDDYKIQDYCTTCIFIETIHGWSDDIIPVEHSIKFAQKTDSTLHLISGDHRLNDSIETVSCLFENFLTTVKKS